MCFKSAASGPVSYSFNYPFLFIFVTVRTRICNLGILNLVTFTIDAWWELGRSQFSHNVDRNTMKTKLMFYLSLSWPKSQEHGKYFRYKNVYIYTWMEPMSSMLIRLRRRLQWLTWTWVINVHYRNIAKIVVTGKKTQYRFQRTVKTTAVV